MGTQPDHQVVIHHRPDCGNEAEAKAIEEALILAMQALDLPRGAEIALVLSDDNELASLNARFRAKQGPTDVLSFPVAPEDLPEGLEPVLGDVLISVAYAQRSAEKAGHSRLDELRLLAVHGLLHLVGHQDETEAGAEAMRALEIKLGVRRE